MTMKHLFITLAVVYLTLCVGYTVAGLNLLILNKMNGYMLIFFIGTNLMGWLAGIVLLTSLTKQQPKEG